MSETDTMHDFCSSECSSGGSFTFSGLRSSLSSENDYLDWNSSITFELDHDHDVFCESVLGRGKRPSTDTDPQEAVPERCLRLKKFNVPSIQLPAADGSTVPPPAAAAPPQPIMHEQKDYVPNVVCGVSMPHNGWFAKCRGCGWMTAHKYQARNVKVPFCPRCQNELKRLPRKEKSSMLSGLLYVHHAWSQAGL